jgi:hypothetical protein
MPFRYPIALSNITGVARENDAFCYREVVISQSMRGRFTAE